MMKMKLKLKHQRGINLIELSITLVVMGLVLAATWQMMPRLQNLPVFKSNSVNAGTTIEQAQRALEGFILANGRLPCPDSTVDNRGVEQCASGNVKGWLPTKTLGISLSEPVRYGVYRESNINLTLDKDLAAMKNRYSPLLPSSLKTDYAGFEQNNPLDFCISALNLAEQGGSKLTSGLSLVPIAYGLAVAGVRNADRNDGSLFDGLNADDNVVMGRFEMQGTPKAQTYDDETRTVGAAELFERLGCTQKLATINSAARATYVAYDLDQLAQFYVGFRTFQVKVSQLEIKQAATAETLAIADTALSAAGVAMAIAGAFESFGAGAAIGLATSYSSLLISADELAAALDDKRTAAEDLVTSNAQLKAAQNYQLQTAADQREAFDRIKRLDGKGLNL
jgi:type II secretory pathway pseudopilin PulG